MYSVIFRHPEQAFIYPKLLNAVNQVCKDFMKNVECSAGYRSLECQIATAKIVLAANKGSYQLENGAVYIELSSFEQSSFEQGSLGRGTNRKCLAAAYGKSNHCYCIAMDLNGWFEDLSNSFLRKYGLIKPLDYEPWHVQLIEHIGISEDKKRIIRDTCLNGGGKMKIKEFQALMGLAPDGIAGTKTKEKAKEMLLVCQEVLGNDFKTAEDIIRATQDNPELWIAKLGEIKYFKNFIFNIVKRLGGKLDEG